MKHLAATVMLVPALALADTCVLTDRSVSQTQVTIQERSAVRRDVVPHPNNHLRCIVSFRVRINNAWHNAHGEYIWGGDRPSSEACAIAADRAESDVRDRIGRSQVLSERIMVCNDRPELRLLRQSLPGTEGNNAQFRPHPNFPNRFYHNGAECRWFVEPRFTGRDLRTYEGVVCEVGPDEWVVVDKF
jgi:hypothetical protein